MNLHHLFTQKGNAVIHKYSVSNKHMLFVCVCVMKVHLLPCWPSHYAPCPPCQPLQLTLGAAAAAGGLIWCLVLGLESCWLLPGLLPRCWCICWQQPAGCCTPLLPPWPAACFLTCACALLHSLRAAEGCCWCPWLCPGLPCCRCGLCAALQPADEQQQHQQVCEQVLVLWSEAAVAVGARSAVV